MAEKKDLTLRFYLDNWYDDYESTRSFNGDVLALCSASLAKYVNLPEIRAVSKWGDVIKRPPKCIYMTLSSRPNKNSYFAEVVDGTLTIDRKWTEEVGYNVERFLKKNYPEGVYVTVEYMVERSI